MATSNPVFKQYERLNTTPTWQSTGSATIEGIITKTGVSLLMVLAVAAATFLLMPPALLTPITIGAALAALVAAFVVASRRQVKPAHIAVYSLIEGVFLGGVTLLFETLYPGIAFQAVTATIVVAGVTLVLFRSGVIRATPRFRRMVMVATLGLLAVYLVNLLLSLFSIHTGIVEVGPSAGMLSWAVSALAVMLATFNLVIDFDNAQTMVNNRAPAQEEWRAAFGLMVTLVWLYIELLRVLSYFRD